MAFQEEPYFMNNKLLSTPACRVAIVESLEGFAGRLGKDRVFGRYFYEIEGCLLTSRSTIIMRNAPPPPPPLVPVTMPAKRGCWRRTTSLVGKLKFIWLHALSQTSC